MLANTRSEKKASAWAPLRERAFLLIWAAALVSNIGTWMHDVAAAWLMTSLAPEPLLVALVQAATTLPVFMDEALLTCDTVYAAAGTAHSIFAIAPQMLREVSGARVVAVSEH